MMDDQTIVCDPLIMNAVIDSGDVACEDPKRGGLRNIPKTHAIIYASAEQIPSPPRSMELTDTRRKATVNVPTDPLNTFGATLGGK